MKNNQKNNLLTSYLADCLATLKDKVKHQLLVANNRKKDRNVDSRS